VRGKVAGQLEEELLFVGLESADVFESVDFFASFDPDDSVDFSPFEPLASESEPEPLPLAPSLAGSFSREPDFFPAARLSVR
jgi:hypothetical protein